MLTLTLASELSQPPPPCAEAFSYLAKLCQPPTPHTTSHDIASGMGNGWGRWIGEIIRVGKKKGKRGWHVGPIGEAVGVRRKYGYRLFLAI